MRERGQEGSQKMEEEEEEEKIRERREREREKRRGTKATGSIYSFLTSETETNEFLRVLGRSRE